MPNIFVSHYKLQKKSKKYISLIINICQYILDNVTLHNYTLCTPTKNKMFSLSSFNYKKK